MYKKIKTFIKRNYLLIILIIISSIIFFTNLSGQDYSLDEPETIVLSRSIFSYGFPSAWDGLNLVSTNNGRDVTILNGNYFYQWQGWLQFYLVYFGINIFGDNVFGQRFFFVLFGVGTIIISFLTGKELFKNKYTPFIVSFQLICCLPFFLYIRAARYYSPSAFFSLLLFYLTISNLKDKFTKKYLIFFIFSGILLFFSNYIIWLTSIIFVLITLFLKRNKAIFYASIVQLFLAIIWFLIFKPYAGDAFIFNQLTSFVVNILKNLSYINAFVFPLILVPFLFLLKKINKKFILVFVFLIVLKICIYSIFLIPHGRYLIDLFVVFLLIIGFFYDYLLTKKKILIFFVLFLFICFTNILNVLPYSLISKDKLIFNLWPQKYYLELSGKYKTIMPQIGEYLKSKYEKGDLFLTNGYPWTIYSYSNVPSLSQVCDYENNKLLGPESITNKDKLRWILIFPLGDNNFSCIGLEDKKNLEKEFKLIKLKFEEDTRIINDIDIFNRQFPPIKIRSNEVLLFEKKN